MTELIWQGKYNDKGDKVAPVRVALPFQTIETVNETTQERQRSLDFSSQGKQSDWRNRLIWGDKKYVLPSLLPEFAGRVNLIYIDPPFDTGADFSFTATIPDHPDTEEDETTQFVKEPSILEQKAYRDTWGRGLESYLQWFYETAVLLRELVSDSGSIFIHLDWHVAHYAKVVLDDVFGYDNFQNEIVWKRMTPSGFKGKTSIGKSHDVILNYSKANDFTYNPILIPYSDDYIKERFSKVDENGRRFKDEKIGTATSKETIARLKQEGRIYVTSTESLRIKHYLDEAKGYAMDDVWGDIYAVNSQAEERIDYPTQKPEPLLERIINASSNENDLVLDCFCGSGTTAAVAEKLNRRWITCDLGRYAIHTTRKRLLQIQNVKPFVVQNLGKYERQQWQAAEFEREGSAAAREQAYRNFILELYDAEPAKGYVWLHGMKAKRMVHIGSVDSPVSSGDVKAIIQEFWKNVGKGNGDRPQTNGVDILGWEFALDMNETAVQAAAANNIDLRFKKIPREVLEKKAVEAGDIKFFELAGLDVKVKPKPKGKTVELDLKDFVIPPDDVPEEARKSIVHWSQWIDYWAVDWNYKDDTFHNEWQSYRTKKEPKILLKTEHTYDDKGSYTIVVKVIDILGNDTTKALKVEVK